MELFKRENEETLKELIDISKNVNSIHNYIRLKMKCQVIDYSICKELGIDMTSKEANIIAYINYLEDKTIKDYPIFTVKDCLIDENNELIINL